MKDIACTEGYQLVLLAHGNRYMIERWVMAVEWVGIGEKVGGDWREDGWIL